MTCKYYIYYKKILMIIIKMIDKNININKYIIINMYNCIIALITLYNIYLNNNNYNILKY